MAKTDRVELQEQYEQIWEDLEDLLRRVALVEDFRGDLSQILEFLKGQGIIREDEYAELTTDHQPTLSAIRAGQHADLTQGKVKDLRSLTAKLNRLRSFI